MRELLVVGPWSWEELGVSPADWPDCRVTERPREADAMAHLATRAVDVVITSPQASVTRVMNIARQALADDNWQSGIEVTSAVPHWISLRVSCRRVNAERLSHFMNELAGGLSATERYQLITAFREVLLNAMEHGAGFDPDKVVEVHAVRTIRTLVYYFKDPGPGFDVHAPQMVASEDDPVSHLDERAAQGKRAGGFGMLLTSKLVDEVHYNERGNEVILVKHLD